MFRKNCGLLHVLLAAVCGLVVLVMGSTALADDYYVYSKFTAPGTGLVFSAGGYVEDYGVPGTWGDEIQYVYFIQAGTPRLAYKVKVWVTNHGGPDDPTPYIDIRQHPAHDDPAHVGPIEPRHFDIVSTRDITAYSDDGGWACTEFHVDATGVYIGAYPYGIHKFDHDYNWSYLGQIAPACPAYGASLAYDQERGVWFACTHSRDVYQISDTNGDGNLMDESWQYIFTHPSYGGGHHDGMEFVGGYLWISDMTSDVLAKWKYDSDTNTWAEVGTYTYTEPAYVEGMGYGPNASFWIAGYSPYYVYEVGGAISQCYPVADAGEDVPSYPPTIPVELDGSGSYFESSPTCPEGKIVLYEWDCDGDGDYDYSGTDPATTCTYPAVYNPDGSIDWDATVQTYTATLRVTDNTPAVDGGPQTSVDACEVHITAPPWKPVADPNGPYNTRINQEVCLDGSGSFHPAAEMYEPGHPWYDEIALWEWDLDNDGEFDDATGQEVCTQWSAEGTYFVGLRVTDLFPTPDHPEMDVDAKCTTVIVGAIHDVAVQSVTPSKSMVIVGEEVTIDVVVSNLGDFTESFDVTLYYDSNTIGMMSVTDMDPGDTETLQFSWDTTGVPEGTYTVKACAATVSGEIIVGNNCLETTVEVVDNRAPACSEACASIQEIWPPNHKYVDIEIMGVTDPDGDPVTITITGITQDEPVDAIGNGDGKTSPDGTGVGTGTACVRAEREGTGNGRVYEISFTATDPAGAECSGSVTVCVPHDQRPGHECIDDGQDYDSTTEE